MNSITRFNSVLLTLLTIALFLSFTSSSTAQESKRFALKGTTELGGSISFVSSTSVTNGNTASNASTVFSVAPFIGYFVADGFEIGLNPFGITSISYAGSSVTQITILGALSYNFKTEGITYPFIEALFGYTSQTDGSSRSGFSWGGRAGVKLAVTDKCLLNLGVQYLLITLNPSGASNRYGSNQLAISAGFTVWF